MKLLLHLFGSFFLISMAYMSFMMVVFWGGAVAQAQKQALIGQADFLMFALPSSCVLAAVMVWIVYGAGWPKVYYGLTLLPLPFFIYFFILMFMTVEK